MPPTIERVMRGVETWVSEIGNIRVVRLHYSSDPAKDEAWVAREKAKSTSEALWQQEQEISFSAKLGTLLYEFNPEYTLIKSFPIPEHWTRWTGTDTHPRKPHACLWCAIDPHDNIYCYREFWPSKVYAKKGNVPEDDNRWTVKEYVEAWAWLESGGPGDFIIKRKGEDQKNHGPRNVSDNPNGDERVYRRVIDYAARGQGKGTTDDDPDLHPDMQARFEREGRAIGFNLHFIDCSKNLDKNTELVNEALRPRDEYDPITDTWVKRSRIKIFEDKCPELVHQLRTVRYAQQTAQMADKEDPKATAINKRNDVSKCLEYVVASKPRYIEPYSTMTDSWRPPQDSSIGY